MRSSLHLRGLSLWGLAALALVACESASPSIDAGRDDALTDSALSHRQDAAPDVAEATSNVGFDVVQPDDGREDAPSDAAADAATDAAADAATDAAADAATDAAADAMSDASCSTADVARTTVHGSVYSNDDGEPIPGALVSVEGDCPPISVATSSAGGFMMRLPVGRTYFLRAASASTVPFIKGFILPEAGYTEDYYVVPTTTYATMASSLSIPLDATKGHVWVSFENATFAGYGATLSVAHGPVITRAADSDTATARSEVTLVGDIDHWFVLFLNVDVGTTTITLNVPAGRTCRPRQVLPSWVVRPGAVTYYEADCD